MQNPVEKFRMDYAAPNYLVTEIQLVLKIYEDYAQILSTLQVKRAGGAPVDAPFVLDGEELELASISLDGEVLPADRYSFVEEDVLQIKGPLPDAFKLECDVKVKPHLNTQLSGLYKSSGVYCTQCEAEGFRRITLMQDRPDVMARFAPRTTLAVRSSACGCAQLRKHDAPPKKIMCDCVDLCVCHECSYTLVRIEACKKACPVLLSNGNLVSKGELPDNRHFTEWQDPFKKPSYLFAVSSYIYIYIYSCCSRRGSAAF